MSSSDRELLAEALRRGRLSTEEDAQLQAYLVSHPEERGFWDEEVRLNQLLAQPPEVTLSSNFTARVLQAIQSEAKSPAPRSWSERLLHGWIPRVATAAAVLGMALTTYYHHEMMARREIARHLAEVSKATGATPLELLVNFEAIQRLNQAPRNADRELIAALQ